MNNADVAKKIIRDSIYMDIATMGEKPWIATLRYRVDDAYTFYSVSHVDSVHMKHMATNTSVACSIFDSHQPDGTGQGLQIEAKASIITDENLAEVLRKIFPQNVEEYMKKWSSDSDYRLFQIVPEHFYILDPNPKEDKRIEVTL